MRATESVGMLIDLKGALEELLPWECDDIPAFAITSALRQVSISLLLFFEVPPSTRLQHD